MRQSGAPAVFESDFQKVRRSHLNTASWTSLWLREKRICIRLVMSEGRACWSEWSWHCEVERSYVFILWFVERNLEKRIHSIYPPCHLYFLQPNQLNNLLLVKNLKYLNTKTLCKTPTTVRTWRQTWVLYKNVEIELWITSGLEGAHNPLLQNSALFYFLRFACWRKKYS